MPCWARVTDGVCIGCPERERREIYVPLGPYFTRHQATPRLREPGPVAIISPLRTLCHERRRDVASPRNRGEMRSDRSDQRVKREGGYVG